MSKMSQISAEMDAKNIPMEQRNSLINRVSAGMHAAEKKIDSRKVDVVVQTPAKKVVKESPEDKWASEIAKKIRAFADTTHNVVTTDGKSYVRAGVYQYIASLTEVIPVFDFTEESTQHEVWCICTLRHKSDNSELTHTTMYASKEEDFLKDKPDFAVLGMAQTRAFVRAMKNVYGYLVELAGYQSVAIEEIEGKEKKNG